MPLSRRPATARLWHLVFAVVGLFALGLQYGLILQTPDRTPLELTLNFFSYFTILTNVLIALAMLAPAIAPDSAPGRFARSPMIRSGATLYAVVVGLVYHFLLHATWNPQGWSFLVNVLLHYVMPTAMLLDWLIFTPKGSLRWPSAARWLAFPLAYGLWTLIHGYAADWWPYWFINAEMLGLSRALINFGGLLTLFFGLGLLVVLIDGLFGRGDRATSAA
ncbi:MAG: Pr6Pr family membrane protein [Brevundimonas sp.]|uniref:Pr6Pr family membrane protein n=1 Tax=Brevundimonas sp. TaxID=1871086 RepID=UPI0040345AA0